MRKNRFAVVSYWMVVWFIRLCTFLYVRDKGGDEFFQGYIFDRKVKFDKFGGDFDIDSGFMTRVGLRF